MNNYKKTCAILIVLNTKHVITLLLTLIILMYIITTKSNIILHYRYHNISLFIVIYFIAVSFKEVLV